MHIFNTKHVKHGAIRARGGAALSKFLKLIVMKSCVIVSRSCTKGKSEALTIMVFACENMHAIAAETGIGEGSAKNLHVELRLNG